MRCILDGHLVLSRQLGQANHCPAIDVLASVSHTFTRGLAATARPPAASRALMAKHAEVRFASAGGRVQGGRRIADEAIAKLPAIHALLRQPADEASAHDTTLGQLQALAT